MKTFSRRTKSLASPSQPDSRKQEQGAAESFLLNSSDPFFFPEGQEAANPRSTAPAASPASKGGGGASGRRRAGGASPAAKAPAAAAAKASGRGAPSGGARQQKAAATGSTARSTQPAAAKQQTATKPAGSLLSHRNSSGSLRQLQQKAEGGSRKQQAPTGGRPSVRSRPAGALPAAAPVAAKPAGTSPGKRKAAAPAAAAAAAAAAAKPAGTSPGKRKAAEPAAAAAAEPDGIDTSPSKKMKKGSSSSSVRSGAAAAAGAPGTAAAGVPASGGAACPAAGADTGGAKPAAGPRPVQQAAAAAGGLAALTRLVNPAALRDQAAATTVVQAQALGEQQSIADDALWALDGLSSGSDATVRDSLAALAEICASRRGRLALRSGNVAADILAAAGGLKVQRDPVQALGLATLLLCFCQADADAALLGRQEVAAAAAQLLKLPSTLDVTADSPGAAGSSTAATKLLAVLKERPYCGQLPAEERGSPLGVALVALSGVMNPHEGSLITDPLKAALRQAGALQAAAQVAADHAPALSDSSPTIQTVRSLWRLHKALLLLENACFACPDNEALLLEVQVCSGVEPLISTAGLVSWLVQQLGLLSRQALITGIKKDCLRALLAVLMNLTQNNPAGCAAVVDAGALAPVAALLAQMVRGGPKIKGVVAGREELAVWLDELSGCLALLINLVEHQPAWRDQLRQLQLPDTSHGASSSTNRLQLVPLLCALLAAVAPRAKGATTPTAAATSLGRRLSLGSGEVTLDCLESVDAGGAASIVEAYGAILLGFLIQDNHEARVQAASLLPGGSLEPVVAAVERCLHFYITAGAMTKSNVESLSALLASLQQQQQQQQQQAGGAGAAGAAAATPGAGAGGSSGEGVSDSLSPVLE